MLFALPALPAPPALPALCSSYSPFPILVTPSPDIAFIIKGNANNGRNPPSSPFPALVTPFPDMAFINEEATGCINEETIGAINEATKGVIIALKNLLHVFLFHVLLFQLHYQLIDLNFLVILRF